MGISSRGHFVKVSALRWIVVMLLVPIPWAGRVWALPFLSALAPSERFAKNAGRRHKTLTDGARQLLLLVARWLPERTVIAVGDSSYAAIELLNAVRGHLTVVTRLRLDARLFEPAPPRRPGTKGRPRVSGARLPSLEQRLADPRTPWRRVRVSGWYGKTERDLDIVSGTALWYLPESGCRSAGCWGATSKASSSRKASPQGFLGTDPDADPLDVLGWVVRRWAVEVTFSELRRHRGVETQRQWTNAAIVRTTPALLGLFSLVTLWAHEIMDCSAFLPRTAAWYPKAEPTFSDALAAIRFRLWADQISSSSPHRPEDKEIPAAIINRLIGAAGHPA